MPNQASQGYHISGKEIEVCSSARLPFLIQNVILMVDPSGVLLHSIKPLRESSMWMLHLAFWLSKPHGQESPLSAPKTTWLNHSMAAARTWDVILAGIFLCNPIFNSYHTGLHLPVVRFLLTFLAVIVSQGKCGPVTQKPPARKALQLHHLTS